MKVMKLQIVMMIMMMMMVVVVPCCSRFQASVLYRGRYQRDGDGEIERVVLARS